MTTHPYGAWPSPLSASDVHAAVTTRGTPGADGGTAYWLETRPGNHGRTALVRDRGDGPEDVSLPGHDVRTRFHEYGGPAAHALRDGLTLYVDGANHQVWRVDGHGPHPITPECEGRVRFACFHGLEPVTSLVRLDLAGPNQDYGAVLVGGRERPVGGPELAADVDSSPDFVLDPAGCSLFGISDLSAIAQDTHKLESRYPWRLVAPWPDRADVYADRSPINRLDQLRTPLILLQGTEDKVVPPAQSELLAAALREKGLAVSLVMFEGEGHGFRDPVNQVRALEVELAFYAEVLGLG